MSSLDISEFISLLIFIHRKLLIIGVLILFLSIVITVIVILIVLYFIFPFHRYLYIYFGILELSMDRY